ncbi:MAG: hypothetical protein H6712_22115 [Myxococcales bacterium]|nr:hypothetical protein [Myxococcales bacterium]MCB9716570.1 hypothetical protein [Myxococcales bacterium]
MSHFVILGRVGAHLIDELDKVLARAKSPGGGVGVGVWLRTVEVAIPFASSDGSDVSPTTIVVGETPLPLAVARELLLPLQQAVLVSAADVDAASPSSRGVLVMRVTLPRPDSPDSPNEPFNPTT